jgi:hypothetical protein
MQYLRFKAEPKSDNPEASEAGGGYVNCWIKNRTEQEANEVASIMIEDNGWIPLRLEEQAEADGPEEGSEAKEYFDQAVLDGEVIVLYTFPKGAIE